MTQAVACIYNAQKDPINKLTGTKPTGGKSYLGKSKPPEFTKGLDDTIDPNHMYHYCKDSGHDLDSCRQLQQKRQRKQLAAERFIAEKALNKKHP